MGVTERPRSLNPRKVIAMTICPIIIRLWPVNFVRSKDAQKQLARTSSRH